MEASITDADDDGCLAIHFVSLRRSRDTFRAACLAIKSYEIQNGEMMGGDYGQVKLYTHVMTDVSIQKTASDKDHSE
uniref:Uncharacterized protein n=1 Tax=Oryza meridionalis TaxID=40149 RepID=A0A0E0EEP7_9ORYZ